MRTVSEKTQQKRPDILLVDMAILQAHGSTHAEIARRLGITQQAVSERISRDRDLFDRIKARYLEECAAARAHHHECQRAKIEPDNNKRI